MTYACTSLERSNIENARAKHYTHTLCRSLRTHANKQPHFAPRNQLESTRKQRKCRATTPASPSQSASQRPSRALSSTAPRTASHVRIPPFSRRPRQLPALTNSPTRIPSNPPPLCPAAGHANVEGMMSHVPGRVGGVAVPCFARPATALFAPGLC